MIKKITLLLLTTTLLFSACVPTKSTQVIKVKYPTWKSREELLKTKPPVEQLMGYYEGTFMLKKPKVNYIGNARRIWANQGYWLYEEQTTSENLEDVLDQTIIHLIPVTRDSIVEETYLLPEDKAESLRMGWYAPEIFDHIKISTLHKAPGCNSTWKLKQNNTFEGATSGLCPFAGGNGVGKRVFMTNTSIMTVDHIGVATKFYDDKGNYTETVGDLSEEKGFHRIDCKPYYESAAKILDKRKKKK